MNICVDCFNLVKGKGKSIGIYNLAVTIVHKLRECLSCEDELYVFGNKYNSCDFEIKRVNFIVVDMDPYKLKDMVLWENFVVNKYVKKYAIESILFPRGYAPLSKLKNCTYTVVINDMIPMFYHEKIKKDYSMSSIYIRKKLVFSAKKANRVITISQFSKEDIVKYSHIKEEKITVIYNPLNCVSTDMQGDGNKYISAITSKLPHKNANGIIKSYMRYYEKSKNPLELRVIGVTDSDVAEYLENVPNEIKKKISFKGYVKTNEEHYSIIKESQFFLFLSLAEGFGFPPIEAMQLDVPVVCSNAGSLLEIVDDAGILVNPYDYEAVSDGMCLLETNDEMRRVLVERGKRNVARFECIEHGKEYLNVMRG